MAIQALGALKNFFPAEQGKPLLVTFSHLRWNFVFQRPQHLLTRAAQTHDVLFFEEPLFEAVEKPMLRRSQPAPSITVLTPVLPQATSAAQAIELQRHFVDKVLATHQGDPLILWYYTPMAMLFTSHLNSDVCVYDCMDELSAFKNAPRELVRLERLLMARADVVFTGGMSIYEAKRRQHKSIHAFPSSIDTSHFRKARSPGDDPKDQAGIARPRVGYFGVIDERLDTRLVGEMAALLPEVQFIMIGPVVKINPEDLPKGANIHWLGGKSYSELPSYMRHWDAGWMPFALNEATRYISPTKTPEFLAAGLPVVSTAIVDVVRTYGSKGLVEIADEEDMVEKLRSTLKERKASQRDKADSFLSTMSWDKTWNEMSKHLNTAPARDILLPMRAEVRS